MENHNSTPRARPPLKFANRVYTASPLNPNKPMGTPQAASSRKLLKRDDLPSSNLNNGSIAAARNLFRASSISSPPAVTTFSPNLPASTMKKVFAPGATPVSQRVYREATAQATPRGMLAKSTSADLFPMRIPSPPPELTGELLAKEIPSELEQKGTVYADQYLAHLVPSDYDDLQRRQLFCVLDLRRLKYAADEIFAKKDWKLNVMNFAKEFEKSRSLIMLRYGLYEFKNVKPSEEVLKKWRAAHGLPEPEEEVMDASPSKQNGTRPAPTKRKAEEQLTPKDTPLSTASPNKNKRRAFDREEEAPVATPAPSKNKRKVSVSDEPDENQPSKMPKSTPSATKALFERISNKQGPASTPTTFSPSKPPPKAADVGSALKPRPNPFAAASNPVNGVPPRSVFENLKPSGGLGVPGNIFGYLSDAGSAKNSGAEADAESSTDSEDETETQEAGQSYEPSVAASAGADTPLSRPSSNPFPIKKPLFGSGLATGPSSTSSDARDVTPGRSLFDRITKGSDGEPVRAPSVEESQKDEATPDADGASTEKEPTPGPVDATWNPNTPIKFTTSTGPAASLFPSTGTSASSLFGAKPAAASNIFGAPKQDKPTGQAATPADSAGETEKSGESDKENSSQPPAKPSFGGFTPKLSGAPASSPFFPSATPFGEPKKDADSATKPSSSLFQSQSPFGGPKKDADEVAKPAGSLFSSSFGAKPEGAPATPAAPASNIFGSQTKPSGSVLQSSTLFGKPAESPSAPATETAKPALFGGAANQSTGGDSTFQSSTLFGNNKPAFGGSNSFGTSGSLASSAFGTGAGSNADAASTKPSVFTTSPSATPAFNFGASKPNGPAGSEPNPLFGTPKAPTPAANPLFGGSPMKQDGPSPAKRLFGEAPSAPSTSMFNFGGPQTAAPTNLFGQSAPAPQQSAPVTFGGGGGPAFTFNASSGVSAEPIRNPFASSTAAPSAPSGGMFDFTGGSSAPSVGNAGGSASFTFGSNTVTPSPSSSFQFGAGGGSQTTAPASSSFTFGAGSAPAPAANAGTPMFGASQSAAPSFNFTSASPRPIATPGSRFALKSSQPASSMFSNLQAPGNGASTTGTNSPFNFGGASSLATTPANGTPEPTTDREGGANADDGEETKHAQITLTEGGPGEEDETIVYEVRAKILKFVPPGQESDSGNDTPRAKSPWTTKGVGPFRLLKHKTTGAVRMLLRAEPRGHIVINRTLLPTEKYRSEEKYVKLTTSNEAGTGLETWMVQVKTKDSALALAGALEANKSANQK